MTLYSVSLEAVIVLQERVLMIIKTFSSASYQRIVGLQLTIILIIALICQLFFRLIDVSDKKSKTKSINFQPFIQKQN